MGVDVEQIKALDVGEVVAFVGSNTGKTVTMRKVDEQTYRFGYDGIEHQTVELDDEWCSVTPDQGSTAIGGSLSFEELISFL